jgi:hypothetical protein
MPGRDRKGYYQRSGVPFALSGIPELPKRGRGAITSSPI